MNHSLDLDLGFRIYIGIANKQKMNISHIPTTTMATTTTTKRPADASLHLVSGPTKKNKYYFTTSKSTREKMELLYDTELQPMHNSFWAGPVFPSKGAKDRSQRRILPPMGVSMLNGPYIEWLEPDITTPNVLEWMRFVLVANADLIKREFEEENTIRHMMKEDKDLKLHVSRGAVSMDIDTNVLFRVGSMRYGSWTLYGRLLMFLHEHKYDVDRSAQISHVMTFVTSKLPLLQISYAMNHTNGDDAGALQLALYKTIDDCLTIFILVRDALYGYDGTVCHVSAHSDAGMMALSIGRNCGQKLRQLIKYNELIRTHLLGSVCESNVEFMSQVGISDSIITMETLFRSLHVDTRVCDVLDYNATYEETQRSNVIKRGMNVVHVDMTNIECMFDHFVKRVYGDGGNVSDPQISHENVASACCLLSMCYGGRSMGVITADKITPMQMDVLDSINETERENFKSLISMCTIDNMITVRGTMKDPAFRANADVGDIHIDNTTVMPRVVLWDMLMGSYERVYNTDTESRDPYPCNPWFAFFTLLKETREWLYEYFRLKCDTIEWMSYQVSIDGKQLDIKMVNRTTQHSNDVRKPMSDIYDMMKIECTKCVTAYTNVPPTGTHILRRFYVSIAFAKYAHNETTMSAFIRINLGHKSGDSSQAYDQIRVNGANETQQHVCNGLCMSLIADMKSEMAMMRSELDELTSMATARFEKLEGKQ